MRTGIPTLHQALTPEAATILKLSLSLAQRRNHAQVTPLHVATTLLTTTSSSITSPPSLSSPTNLLKRACLKSQHHHHQHQPNYNNSLLHCRALELCFNVALNRLPTCTSSSSPSSSANGANPNPNPNHLMHASSSYPTLSNALIAALKRAQANQRRGCIELQQQQSQLQQNQNQNQNQPLLAIKVELEQLIISILDDPSVSRVMREAGFSSSLVKSSLEEEREKECSVLSLGQSKDLWHNQFMIKPSFDHHQDPVIGIRSQKEEDVRCVLEVMMMGSRKKKNKRSNPVLVGDSVSLTESLVEEIKRRLERGDVPGELKGVQFVKLGMSVLVGKEQIEAKMEEIKRNLMSSSSGNNGAVVYVGDLKWAAEEDESSESSVIRCIVEEIERLVTNGGNKLWVMGIASYQSYMEVKRRRPGLEMKWGLHAVTVPSGGLSLSLQAPAQSGMEPRMARLNQSSYQLFEAPPPKSYFAPKEEREEEREMLCFECNANYEREASIILNTDSRGTGGIQMPSWLRPNRPVVHHKVNLMELRSKWSRLCQKLHQFKSNNSQFYPPFLNSNFSPKNLNLLHPIWGPCNQTKPMFDPLHTAPLFHSNCPKTWPPETSHKEIKITNSATNLFLGGLFNLSDSATSESKESRNKVEELEKRLSDNIPWQHGAIGSIVEAFEKRESVILLEGNDTIAKRRVALVVAETYCGSSEKVIRVNPFKFDLETVLKEVEREKSCVVLIEGISQVPTEFHDLIGCLKEQSGAIIILTNSSRSDGMFKGKCPNLRFLVELPSDNDLKRKSPLLENEVEKEPKRHKGEIGLDLNLSAFDNDDEEEVIPSDITHEDDGFDDDRRGIDLPQSLFQNIGARVSMISAGSDGSANNVSNRILARLNRACANGADQFGDLSVDKEVIEWLVWAYSNCLEPLFEKWVKEVFQICVPTVKKGGKVRLVLGVGRGGAIIGGGIEGSEEGIIVPGFCGSVLPEKIQLD